MLLHIRLLKFLHRRHYKHFFLLCAVILTGCSVYMEANRPRPVNLAQFQLGQTRDYVLEQLGMPSSSAVEADGASCDFYQLYTRGYGNAGKIPIAIAEGTADVFTLGLAEVISTPIEGATKNELHPVTFCYENNALVRLVSSIHPRPDDSANDSAPLAVATPDVGDVSTEKIPPSEPAPLERPLPHTDTVPASSQTE
jgi:hypothetical protein